MVSPSPHQDNVQQPAGTTDVTIIEHVSALIASVDRRFDTLHQDLKDDIEHRLEALYNQISAYDLRYQQRYDSQQLALRDALAAQEKAVSAALAAQIQAVNKSEVANEKRFDSVNEFRAQLADQAATFMPRAEAEARWANLAEKVEDLKGLAANEQGRSTAIPTTSDQIRQLSQDVQSLRDSRATTQGTTAGSNLEARFDALATQLTSLATYRDTVQGRTLGANQLWGYIVGGVGFAIGLVLFIIQVTGR